jgi:hypothetical protein
MKCIRYSNLLLLISCLLASLLCTAQAIADVMGMDIEIRLYAWVQVRKQRGDCAAREETCRLSE